MRKFSNRLNFFSLLEFQNISLNYYIDYIDKFPFNRFIKYNRYRTLKSVDDDTIKSIINIYNKYDTKPSERKKGLDIIKERLSLWRRDNQRKETIS